MHEIKKFNRLTIRILGYNKEKVRLLRFRVTRIDKKRKKNIRLNKWPWQWIYSKENEIRKKFTAREEKGNWLLR